VPKVKDIMTDEVVSVAPFTPVIDVAQKILTSRQWVIPVCDNHELKGVITERDLVVSIVATARDPVRVYAGSLMNNHLPTISPGEDIWFAAKLMAENAVRVMPVVDNGKLVGMLTLDNLARESRALAALVIHKTFNTRE